jgi:hypothetical protein
MYGELEVLKQQLASLKALEEDLDASESILDATEPGVAESLPLEKLMLSARMQMNLMDSILKSCYMNKY